MVTMKYKQMEENSSSEMRRERHIMEKDSDMRLNGKLNGSELEHKIENNNKLLSYPYWFALFSAIALHLIKC
jgi:hypothetical protein